MSSRLLVVRNVVIVVGSFYVATQLLAPIWFLLFKIVERPDRTLPLGWLLGFLMELSGAVLAGGSCGYLLKSARPLAWSTGVANFVAIAVWSSAKWFASPQIVELLKHATQAIVVGSLAGATCWLALRRRRKSGELQAPVTTAYHRAAADVVGYAVAAAALWDVRRQEGILTS